MSNHRVLRAIEVVDEVQEPLLLQRPGELNPQRPYHICTIAETNIAVNRLTSNGALTPVFLNSFNVRKRSQFTRHSSAGGGVGGSRRIGSA